MKPKINRDSPVPIYHQIAEALRNAIAVGSLKPGAGLPSVRDAAGQWGVNLHTVRKAYGELARDGLVMVDRQGSRVTPSEGGEAGSGTLDALIATFVRTGDERFGMTQIQLGQLLLKRAAAAAPVPVHFIECSRQQAEGHCTEIMAVWRVQATPLVLGGMTELPAGVVISTYFHYNDIRQRWPEQIDNVRFVAIAPDPSLPRQLPAHDLPGRQRLLVCELEEAKAVNIAADLSVLIPPDRYELQPCVLSSPSALPPRSRGDVVLAAPRVWGAMTEAARRDVVLIRYRLRSYELEALGESFGWRRWQGEVVA